MIKKTEQVVCPNCRYVWYKEIGKQITEDIAKEILKTIDKLMLEEKELDCEDIIALIENTIKKEFLGEMKYKTKIDKFWKKNFHTDKDTVEDFVSKEDFKRFAEEIFEEIEKRFSLPENTKGFAEKDEIAIRFITKKEWDNLKKQFLGDNKNEKD